MAFLHWRAWATSHARDRLLQLVKDCCKRCRITSRPNLIAPIIIEEESDSIDIDKDLLEPSQFTDMLQKLIRYYNQLQAAFDSQDEDAKRGLEDLLGQAKDLKIMLGDRLTDIDPVVLRAKIKDAQVSSDEENEEKVPNVVSIEMAEDISFALNHYEEDENARNLRSEELSNMILNNPKLLEQDKEELLADFNANKQKIDQALDKDMEKAKSDINKRLQKRAERRKNAEKEKNSIEQKKEEILNRCEKDKERVNIELEAHIKVYDSEFIEERDNIKKENRKVIDESLKEMRTRLQEDLMSARNQNEIDNLMKIFEIDAKRLEDKLLIEKKQQEAEALKKIEERRKNKIEKMQRDAENRKKEIELRKIEEIDDLEQRTLLVAGPKTNVEIQLDINDQNFINEVVNNYETQKLSLEVRQANEINNIDQEIQTEENNKAEQREKLKKLIQTANSDEEKESLMKALQEAEAAEDDNKLKQEDKLKAKLAERRRKRAEKEAELKIKHENEIKDLEQQKQTAEKELRSTFELKKMEELINNSDNLSPEELIAMARELLEKKHDRETAELTGLKHNKLRDRQNLAIEEALTKKAEEKAIQRANYEDSKKSIMKEKIDPATREAKLNELEVKLQEADNQIDYNFIAGINNEQDRIWREIENDFKDRFAVLADAQTKEIKDIMSKIKGTDLRMLEANIGDMEKEIEQQKAEFAIKYAEKMSELDKRSLEFRENEKKKLLEIDFINNQVRELQEQQRKIDEVQEQRRNMQERQQKQLELMKERGISKEKMEEMLSQHQQELEEWEKAMEKEKIRQQQKLQAKIDLKRQKYQEKMLSRIQKYKEENLKLIEKQEEAEQKRLKIVFDCGRDLKIWTPKVEIETKLRVPDIEQEKEITKLASNSLLDEVITKVKRVEAIAENIDTKQFNLLLKAFNDVSDMMESLKNKI